MEKTLFETSDLISENQESVAVCLNARNKYQGTDKYPKRLNNSK